jgi:hypothetical protein
MRKYPYYFKKYIYYFLNLEEYSSHAYECLLMALFGNCVPCRYCAGFDFLYGFTRQVCHFQIFGQVEKDDFNLTFEGKMTYLSVCQCGSVGVSTGVVLWGHLPTWFHGGRRILG